MTYKVTLILMFAIIPYPAYHILSYRIQRVYHYYMYIVKLIPK